MKIKYFVKAGLISSLMFGVCTFGGHTADATVGDKLKVHSGYGSFEISHELNNVFKYTWGYQHASGGLEADISIRVIDHKNGYIIGGSTLFMRRGNAYSYGTRNTSQFTPGDLIALKIDGKKRFEPNEVFGFKWEEKRSMNVFLVKSDYSIVNVNDDSFVKLAESLFSFYENIELSKTKSYSHEDLLKIKGNLNQVSSNSWSVVQSGLPALKQIYNRLVESYYNKELNSILEGNSLKTGVKKDQVEKLIDMLEESDFSQKQSKKDLLIKNLGDKAETYVSQKLEETTEDSSISELDLLSKGIQDYKYIHDAKKNELVNKIKIHQTNIREKSLTNEVKNLFEEEDCITLKPEVTVSMVTGMIEKVKADGYISEKIREELLGYLQNASEKLGEGEVKVLYTTKNEITDPENPDSPSYTLQVPSGFHFDKSHEPVNGQEKGKSIEGKLKLLNPDGENDYTGDKTVNITLKSESQGLSNDNDVKIPYVIKSKKNNDELLNTKTSNTQTQIVQLSKNNKEENLDAYLTGKSSVSGDFKDRLIFEYTNVNK